MAKIQSASITNASGSIGGMTFAKNRGGLYLRARAAVTNPQTAGQTLIRTMLTNASTTWRTLTENQRQGWYDWAAVNPRTNFAGDPLILTGHQLFIAFNTPRLQAGLPLIPDSPVDFGQPVVAILQTNALPSVVIDGDDVDLTITLKTQDPNPGDFLLYLSKPQSPSTRFFKGPYQLINSTPAVVSGDTVITADQTVLPPVGVGSVFYYRILETLDDGRLSAPLVGSIVVTEAP